MSLNYSDEELYSLAENARQYSYSPYSHYAVGAAVLMDDGAVYTGCNIENASFGATNCAERTAIFKAVSEGHSTLAKVAIAGSTDDAAWPCGMCRQVMAEFADKDCYVIVKEKVKLLTRRLDELLPEAFKL